MILSLSIFLVFSFAVHVYTQLPPFGASARGARKERISKSPQWHDGIFKNTNPTPNMAPGINPWSLMYKSFFGKGARNRPSGVMPSIKTDLHSLPPNQNSIVWFGHSSYFMQIDGKKILVDPVFSGRASPLPGTVESYKGSDAYIVDDMPAIDYLFISHDHWDHLDYPTIKKLRSKVGMVITGLGVGADLERWGYDQKNITEADWGDEVFLAPGFTVHATPARHYSRRGFFSNGTLWMSFVLQTPTLKLFLGGDSGYDEHFAAIGTKHGPFDLAILECGQYNESWPYVHSLPAEVALAFKDLGARRLLPVHWGKFSLAFHDWDTPIKTISDIAEKENIILATPQIGEVVDLKDTAQTFTQWWKNVDVL